MASSVGVLFYWLRRGDHPEIARQTKGKLPIDNTSNITVGKAITAIAITHTISLTKYTIAAFEEKSSRQLTNPEELLTNYSRIYLSVDSKKIEDLKDGEGTLTAEAERAVETGGSDWSEGVASGSLKMSIPSSSTWHPITSKGSEPQLAMEKVLVISSHVNLPLMLPANMNSHKNCPLCQQLPPEESEMLECCNYTCCAACLSYLLTSSLYVDTKRCVVCGKSTASHLAGEAARLGIIKVQGGGEGAESTNFVKRERGDDAGGGEPATKHFSAEGNLGSAATPVNPETENEFEDDEDYEDDLDDFGESGPLRL